MAAQADDGEHSDAKADDGHGGPAGASSCRWLCMVRPGHMGGASVAAWGALVQLLRPSMARRRAIGYICSNFWALAASGVFEALA